MADLKPSNTNKIVGSNHEARMRHLLATYSERGKTLKEIATPKIMGRSAATLKKYCRRFEIAFPDYTPNAMKSIPKEQPFQ